MQQVPVVVGVAQSSVREVGADPVDMMVAAVEAALADAGGRALRSRIASVRVNRGIWPYRNPGAMVAQRLGVPDAETTLNRIGGNEVYELVAATASAIRDGELDAAVICAAEHLRTRRADHAAGRRTLYMDESDDAAPDVRFGDATLGPSEDEWGSGVATAVNFYAMVENLLRHRSAESPSEHRARIARLWASAAEVAASNPHAWTQDSVTADRIASVGPDNRMVASPYPKLLTSNVDVDQAAAVVLCSADVARECGVPRGRWVHPLVATAASDPFRPTNRLELDDSPAMRAAGARALELLASSIDDIELVDLYSCFPSAVQVSAAALGMPLERPFTITGGLTFAGGPLNSYCMHALATAVERLREADPGTRALLSGNGGYFSKHSFLALGTEPRKEGFVVDAPQAGVDALGARPDPAPFGSERARDGMIESFTVTHHRSGEPETAIVAALDAAGSRHWRALADGEAFDACVAGDPIGESVHLTPAGLTLA